MESTAMISGKQALVGLIALQIVTGCTPASRQDGQAKKPDEELNAVAASGPPTLTAVELADLHRSAQHGDIRAMATLDTLSIQWVPECARSDLDDCNRLKNVDRAKIALFQKYNAELIRNSNSKEMTCQQVWRLAKSDLKMEIDDFLKEKARFYNKHCLGGYDPKIDHEDRTLVEKFFGI